MGSKCIFLLGRLIKVFAHVIKFLSYGFHAVFPHFRFRLPRQSGPMWRARTPSRIPRIIWQTNYTDRLTLPLYVNYLFNRLMAPTFEYRFMITEDRAAFIRENFAPEYFDAYSRIKIGAGQADFWRVLVLNKLGGVYMDIDAHLIWFLGRILKPEDNEIYVTIREGDISNYFFGSQPGNPHLETIIEEIRTRIMTEGIGDIWQTTGPAVFIRVLKDANVRTVSYRQSCMQGNFTNEYFQYVDKPEGKWIHAQQRDTPADSGDTPTSK